MQLKIALLSFATFVVLLSTSECSLTDDDYEDPLKDEPPPGYLIYNQNGWKNDQNANNGGKPKDYRRPVVPENANQLGSRSLAEPIESDLTSVDAMNMDSISTDSGPQKEMPPITVDLSMFNDCVKSQCNNMCGVKDRKFSRCDSQVNKLCLCAVHRYRSAETTGKVLPVNMTDDSHLACQTACRTLDSYARIRVNANGSKNCFCLTNQKSRTGITLCDEFAPESQCKSKCRSPDAICSFDGACLCKSNWANIYNMTVPNIRKEDASDNVECSKRCIMYHHDYVPRIYDPKMKEKGEKTYEFRDKYCLCGPEETANTHPQTRAIIKEGFQVCTGLKCKLRCGMREAVCEANFRRACLCPRQNIFIGPHLWSRLPGRGETFCYDACTKHGLHPRIIEKNPLLDPAGDRFGPFYRKSAYQYQYDGKFCHCIKIELDLNMFRPCSVELCRFLCGHHEAMCDAGTRRDCICNTHKMVANIGRRPDPGEANCDITCRFHLLDARVIELVWKTTGPIPWINPTSKFCGCVRPVSPAGLTHCDGHNDLCPKYCNKPHAYCTREKYCECGLTQTLLEKGTAVRLPTGKEMEECGERCRSWLWPIAEDTERVAYIYDEAREKCSIDNSCPRVDTTPWVQAPAGSLARDVSIFEEAPANAKKRYCLCAKNTTIHYSPGARFLPNLQPYKAPVDLECIGNNTCAIVGNAVVIVA